MSTNEIPGKGRPRRGDQVKQVCVRMPMPMVAALGAKAEEMAAVLGKNCSAQDAALAIIQAALRNDDSFAHKAA
jgi:hypothetical protein